VNQKKGISGSLFQKRTKSKLIDDQEYMVRCMHYIHQNPLVAGLAASKLEDWKYSSFPDYAGLRKGSLCNKSLLFELTDYDQHSFMKDSYDVLDEDMIKFLY
jgi:putative transposase